MSRPIIFSYGGGTQSAAICVLIAQGKLPRPERIVMADTGREATQTWDYLRDTIQPLLATVNLTVEIIPHTLSIFDLYQRNGMLLLPVYTAQGRLNSGWCSEYWKRLVVFKYLRQNGYGPRNPVTMWIGISLDEIGRAKPGKTKWAELNWPLLMQQPMRRDDCKRLVINAGLPEPPKSSCWMCPYRSDRQWAQLKELYPEDFQKAVELEAEIQSNDTKDGLWLTKHRQPLNNLTFTTEHKELPLFGQVEHCDSGFCWV